MPRVSKSWSYEASKKRYVANINRQKIILLEQVEQTKANDKIADDKYAKAKAVAMVQVTGDLSPIDCALSDWLRWIRERPSAPVSLNTFYQHRNLVMTFTALYGDVLGRDITVQHIESWIAHMKQDRKHPETGRVHRWEEGTVKTALQVLNSAFSYCERRGLLSSNPFKHPDAVSLRNPSPIDYEGKKIPIEQEEYTALVLRGLTRASKDWAILCMLMWETGARPTELIGARAEEWDRQNKRFVIEAQDPANMGRFKMKRKKKNRIIYVPDDLVPFVDLLVEKYKDAPKFPANYHQIVKAKDNRMPQPAPMPGVAFLFRVEPKRSTGLEGSLPHTPKTFNERLKSTAEYLNKKAGKEVVRRKLTGYSFRHSFTTRWLVSKKGGELKLLAELLGTSVAMIEKHYSHLCRKHDVLRDSLNDFHKKARFKGD